MSMVTVPTNAKRASIEAVIHRCGCGKRGVGCEGATCPQRIDLPMGVVADWHRNPLRRWIANRLTEYKLKRRIRRAQATGFLRQG